MPTDDGWKPHVVREMLDLPPQTLRIWRDRLDPPGDRYTHFSAGRVLLYRIFEKVIHHRHIPVRYVERCDIAALLEQCEEVAPTVLAQCYLLIDPGRSILKLCNEEPVLGDLDDDAQVLPMKNIVHGHLETLAQWGRRRAGQPQRLQLEPPEAVRVVRTKRTNSR